MTDDLPPRLRHEVKHVITEATAREIRRYLCSFLDLDEHCMGHPDSAYPVHSLYLDSRDMKTYWDTINGIKNRFKLRIRFYDDAPDRPVYLEIKRRRTDCISKERVPVPRAMVPEILAGRLPPLAALPPQTLKCVAVLETFCRLTQELGGGPKVHVAYTREAYLHRGADAARLTLDRQVRMEPEIAGRMSTVMRKPILIWGDAVVLELKFTKRLPDWYRDLVRMFELRQCGAAKYADGVTLLSGHLPQHRNQPWPNSALGWPVPGEGRKATTEDVADTPSFQSVAQAVRGPTPDTDAENPGAPTRR